MPTELSLETSTLTEDMFCKHKILQTYTEITYRGAWVAQSVNHQTLDFGLGHDLTVCEFKPRIRLSALSTELTLDALSPSCSALPMLVFSLSLSKINKTLKKKKENHIQTIPTKSKEDTSS